MFDDVIKKLLSEVADLTEVPLNGAFNIRNNGHSEGRNSTENIQIVPKENNSGIDIYIKPGTRTKMSTFPL